MLNSSKTRLKTLVWEIKNRLFHFCFSFFLSLFVCYAYSQSLLYLLVSSSEKKNIVENSLLFCALHKNLDTFSQHNASAYWQNHGLVFSSVLRKMDKQELDNFCHILELMNNSILKFIFTNVQECFSSLLVICFVFSFFAVIPYFIYIFIMFLFPILFLHDRKKFLFCFRIFFVLWLFFNIGLQYKIIPIFAEFFVNFNINDSGFKVLAETKIYCYCIWTINIFIKGNLCFCLFICLIFLSEQSFWDTINQSKKIQIRVKLPQRKMCLLIILILSAALAPPDLIYQSFLAFVLTFCFEILIYLFFIYTAFINYRTNTVSLKQSFVNEVDLI